MGIQTSTINSGPVAGFKNKIINGNFNFWQRGTSFTITTNASTYTADRWYHNFTNTNTGAYSATVSRQAFTLGQTEVPDNPVYFIRHNVTAVGSTPSTFECGQRIEDVTTLSGKQVTVSFYAKASSDATASGLTLFQFFGTGGSPSTSVSTSLGTLSLTTSWQKFTFTITVPSVSGKTLGTDGNSYIMLNITLPVAVRSYDFAQVQVEEGPVATDFEQRPQQTELGLCERYYIASRGGGGMQWSNGQSTAVVSFPTTMRAAPSISFSSIRSGSPSTSTANWNAADASTGGFRLDYTTTTSFLFCDANYTASAEL